MQHIQTVTLASDAATITLDEIPDGFTDLLILYSLRSNRASSNDYDVITANGVNFTVRQLLGNEAGVLTGVADASANSSNTATANTFANGSLYLPNYRSSVSKSGSIDVVTENNSNAAQRVISALLFATTDPITTIVFDPKLGTVYRQHSSVSIYGITAGSDGIVSVS